MTTGITNPKPEDIDAISHDFARTLDSLISHGPQMATDKLFVELDQICTRFIEKVAFSQEFQLEIKRRIAEWKFMLISERNLPYGEVLPLYEHVCVLGFTDLERDATMRIYFAQYCVRHSRGAEAKKTLEDLRARLASAHAHDGLAVWKELIRDTDRILLQIQGE